LGARQLIGARVRVLRWIFGVVVAVMAVEMIVSGLKGSV
jgi:small neutral amino acid transporter SnatA (MarC family)